MEWINVSDELPKNGGRYWCYVIEINDLGKSGFQWNCYYDDRDREFRDSRQKMYVTHWMPLPEPPHQPKLTWQRSTKRMPDIWIPSTNEEYEIGRHIERFNWRQKEI